MYSQNCCYPDVTDRLVPGLTIIFSKKKPTGWMYKNIGDKSPFMPQSRDIGSYNYSMRKCSSGVIGVYDGRNINHLRDMLRHWQFISDNDE
jgi:hypothetical protein